MARLRHGPRVAVGGGWKKGMARPERVQCDRCDRLVGAQSNGKPEYHFHTLNGTTRQCKPARRYVEA